MTGATKLDIVFTYNEELPSMSQGPLITWSCKVTQQICYIHYHNDHGHQTWHGGYIQWGALFHKVTWSLDHLVLPGHVTNTLDLYYHKAYDYYFGKMMNFCKGLPHIRSCNSLITWSHEVPIVRPPPPLLPPFFLKGGWWTFSKFAKGGGGFNFFFLIRGGIEKRGGMV